MLRLKYGIICLLLALFCSAELVAQPVAGVPKVVVNVIIDQLRDDYLQYFQNSFGERGFKRLKNEGTVYHNVDFGFHSLSRSASVATIVTGTYPYYHGVTGDKKYDCRTLKEVSIVADDEYIGNFTGDRLSPAGLLSSTVGDELKVASGGFSDVFAIAPDADAAILAAGHFADAAFWIDDYNGNWASTTYYRNIPWYVDRYNAARNRKEYPAWTPMFDVYNGFPYLENTEHFKYSFRDGDGNRFRRLKQSPIINSEVTDLAAVFFDNADFGKRSFPDLLNVIYYAGNYHFRENTSDFNLEIQDIYCRLDREIERLIDIIEKKAGIGNTLVIVSSTGYYDSKEFYPDGRKANGKFYPDRCTALLNVYLMALYGEGNWVNGYYNQQIFLNHDLIGEMKVDPDEILRKAADFMAQFSGVQEVTTAGQWFVNDTGRAATFRRGMHKKICGDIFIELQPGWIVDKGNFVTRKDAGLKRNESVMTPLFFFGIGLKHADIYRKISATQIAPSVSYLLRINSPNSCRDFVLEEFILR
ncbi:MAG: alkaline phosphatase family protein [Dysgonamonadaceae bacterium]|jgi:hypothetical protein|nr:alkaline phosphatase family protein [Dysgonamonadaceae bacterium]